MLSSERDVTLSAMGCLESLYCGRGISSHILSHPKFSLAVSKLLLKGQEAKVKRFALVVLWFMVSRLTGPLPMSIFDLYYDTLILSAADDDSLNRALSINTIACLVRCRGRRAHIFGFGEFVRKVGLVVLFSVPLTIVSLVCDQQDKGPKWERELRFYFDEFVKTCFLAVLCGVFFTIVCLGKQRTEELRELKHDFGEFVKKGGFAALCSGLDSAYAELHVHVNTLTPNALLYELKSTYKMNVLLSIEEVLEAGTFQKNEGVTSDFACKVMDLVPKIRRVAMQKDEKHSFVARVAARVTEWYFPRRGIDWIGVVVYLFLFFFLGWNYFIPDPRYEAFVLAAEGGAQSSLS